MLFAAIESARLPLYVIAGYMGLLIALGIFSSRFFRGTSADYFVVSRSIGPFLLLMSVFGTTMTGFALVGSTGKAYTSGIGVYGLMASWSGLIHSAVFFLVGMKLWAVGKRYGYVTQCQYFRERFESPALGYLLFPILVLLVIPYLLVGVIAAGKFLQATTAGAFPDLFPSAAKPLIGGIPPWLGSLAICLVVLFYVFVGGLRGAVWANTFQTLVFMATGIIAFYMISTRLGGLSEASRLVAEHSEASSRLAREGQIGYLQFLSYCFIPLSVGMFPHLFQHWLTARSAKSFRLTVIAHPICIMIVWAPCILIGMWAAGYLGTGANANAVLGRMVHHLVESPILSGLVGAGVLAAIMSSLDSQFMCIGTMFTNDIVVRLFGKERFTDTQKIWLARGFILLVVAITYFLALLLKDSAHVFDLGVWCFSGFASLFPIAFAAVYWKRATRAGAIASLVVTTIVWLVLFYRDILAVKPPGVEELLLFGLMPVTFIFASAVITLVVVSLLTQPPAASTIDKFFDPAARERASAAVPTTSTTPAAKPV
jgi:solute:Na+ symporter, SSS family